MKTPIAFILMLLSQLSFGHVSNSGGAKTTSELADNLLVALQHESTNEFLNLFPSLSEFVHLFDLHAELYGPFLEDAKNDFRNQYNSKIVHQVKRNFDTVLQEGKNAGVVWSQVKISHLEYGAGTIDIVFKHNQEEFRLQVEKIQFINGAWKTTRFIKLI